MDFRVSVIDIDHHHFVVFGIYIYISIHVQKYDQLFVKIPEKGYKIPKPIARTDSERPVHGSAVQRYAVLVHAAGLARSLARLTGRLWVKEITCCLMR